MLCAVDGVWSDWSPWGKCAHVFKPATNIRCKTIRGSQSRERLCLHQDHNGTICPGDTLLESRVCYDVQSCYSTSLTSEPVESEPSVFRDAGRLLGCSAGHLGGLGLVGSVQASMWKKTQTGQEENL